jgi:hypothetical protein
MLPVLKAVAFQEFALQGGARQPCIVSVMDENNNFLNDSYVVKIFQDHILNLTCKEVYASVLAKHFDLNTPEPVLIEVNNAMINELKKHEKYKNWQVTEGVFFGSKYVTGAKSFTDTLPLKRYDYWVLTNIFAFDVLIMNWDRQREKPNVIIKNKDIYVIDHELSMNISKPFDAYLNQNHWEDSINQNRGGHLFGQYLRHFGKKNKVTFDEFFENLRTLNPQLLYNFAEQLAEYEYNPVDIDKIISYLAEVKTNETKFSNLLDNLLL